MQQTVCDHIGLFTHDSEALARFYVDVLGFEMRDVSILPKSIAKRLFDIASDCRFTKLSRHGFVLEMFEPVSPDTKKLMLGKACNVHWGYCAKNRGAFVEELRKQDLEIIEVNRNGHNVYFLVDPDGNRIEIRECGE